MKRAVSILCICAILMAGALTALICGRPHWVERIADAVGMGSGPVAVENDEEFPYKQSKDEWTFIVSPRFPMEEECKPDDLVNLYEHKDRSFELARADIELRRPAYLAAQEMFAAAASDGVEDFILSSGYRTRERQAELYAQSDTGYVNAPGESEHEYGLTFDVTTRTDKPEFDQTPQFAWLQEHAHEYGFILRYPADKEALTGVPYESWHYRYVGKDAARKIKDKGWCLEEYVAAQ